MSLRTIDKRRDLHIRRQFRQLDNSVVSVGLHHDSGFYEDSLLPVPQIGFWNHFGTKTVPSRPWMSLVVDQKRERFYKIQDDAFNAIIEGSTVRKGLERLGAAINSAMKSQIRRSPQWATPLTIGTINEKFRKQSRKPAHPLIDTEKMLKAHDFEVSLRVTPLLRPSSETVTVFETF